MAFFRCEMFDKNGKVIESQHIEISIGDVSEAAKNKKIIVLKKKAQQQGLAFRIKREDN